VPIQRVGDLLAVDRQLAAPGAHLSETLRVERDSVAAPHDVWLFLHDVEQAIPRQVRRDALGFVEHDAQSVQRFDHLDAVIANMLVEAVLIDGAAQVDSGLHVSPPHQ
jgi:hypothetical protein